MADTLVKNPKLIVGTQSQVEAEMGDNDIGFATDIKFYTAKEVDDLLSGLGGGASLPILTMMMSDHVIDDMSWLRSDTFSWQSGDVYKAAYEHLVGDLAGLAGTQYYAWTRTVDGGVYYTISASPDTGWAIFYKDSSGDMIRSGYVMEGGSQTIYNDGGDELTRDSSKDETVPQKQTDTIGDITITYYLAQDGHKICLPDQETNIVVLYNKTGTADYYVLDTTNKQFKLPRKQKRKLIQAVKNGNTWYKLYSDGWVEQGGYINVSFPGNADAVQFDILLDVEMANTDYMHQISFRGGFSSDFKGGVETKYTNRLQGFVWQSHQMTAGVNFFVAGYAAESAYASAGMNLEYYYVGNFEQSAVEQTAGLNAELFNGKADVDLRNTNFNELTFKTGNFNTRVVQQGDGNFVIYKNGTPIISTAGDTVKLPANSIPQGGGDALACHSINMSENGYIRLTNGLIIQWGRHYGKGAQSYTVTLPTAFSNAAFSIVYTQGAASMGEGIYANTNLAYPSSTTTFNVFRVYSEECTANWIAIGY